MDMLAFVGLIIAIIGGIGFLIEAFKTSILWGIGCLILTPVSLVFLIMHWGRAKNPFLLQLVGIAVIVLASAMGADVSFW